MEAAAFLESWSFSKTLASLRIQKHQDWAERES